jgi:predicted GH43/DUF377 family glycosyl hydrolase
MPLDLNNSSKVLARSAIPIMEPEMDYEKQGFFGNVVFTKLLAGVLLKNRPLKKINISVLFGT